MKEKATKTMKSHIAHKLLRRASTLIIPLVALSCSSNNDLVSNYYEDGIYYDSEYGGSLLAEELGLAETEPVRSGDGYDYYDPNDIQANNATQNNSNFNNRTTYFNTGFGYNPYWGMGMGMGMGWGYNPYWGFYNPYFPPMYAGYPYYSPWGRPYWGWYDPWYPGFGPGYGYGYWGPRGYPVAEAPRGTNGRIYRGAKPNRYNGTPRAGRPVSGSGKMASTSRPRTITASPSRAVSRPASRLRELPNHENRYGEAMRRPTSRTLDHSVREIPTNRTVTREAREAVQPARQVREPRRAARPIQRIETPAQSRPVTRPSREINIRPNRTSTTPPRSYQRPEYVPQRSNTPQQSAPSRTPQRSYELNTPSPSRSAPSSTPSYSRPQRSTSPAPSRSSSPSRSSGGSTRTIRR